MNDGVKIQQVDPNTDETGQLVPGVLAVQPAGSLYPSASFLRQFSTIVHISYSVLIIVPVLGLGLAELQVFQNTSILYPYVDLAYPAR